MSTDGLSGVVKLSIIKPSGFDLNEFRSTLPDTVGGVETFQTGLPVHSISQAKDFVRLHPNEDYWSPELCFVSVPVRGSKKDSLHLVREDLAVLYLPGGKVQRARLALACKPYNQYFLCRIPTRNMDNKWNVDNVAACEQAKTVWVQATSRAEEGVDGYFVQLARDAGAFPQPKWPTQTLNEMIMRAFEGRAITSDDNPALLRLIGGEQAIQ
jgi:hypothetical protein